MATKVAELINNGKICVEKKYVMSYNEFAKDHRFAIVSVVIGYACKDWTAKDRFTPYFFKSEYDDKIVKIQGQEYKLGDFIYIMENASPENPAPYPCNLQLK